MSRNAWPDVQLNMRPSPPRTSPWAAALFLAVASVACQSPTGPDAGLDASFTMKPGDRVTLQNTTIAVQFVGVDGDSRCPADAFCVLGGDAIVRVSITTGGTTREYEFHTGDLQPIVVEPITIRLEVLAPYPFSGQSIEPGDYRATLRIASR